MEFKSNEKVRDKKLPLKKLDIESYELRQVSKSWPLKQEPKKLKFL